ncbi:hypothetical protein, partial [Nostoc sp.]|uniref:hypothetical protein n=1 Tax=Nostoc sp. TaxID=1180 RepID=UPI002FF6D2BD
LLENNRAIASYTKALEFRNGKSFRRVTEEGYSGSRLSEVQEPHPQPPKSKRGGDYDVPHVIMKRYINTRH